MLVLSVSSWAASLLARLLELRGAREGGVRAASTTGVVRTLVKVAVLAIGTLVLLSLLGISVTPLLTTMGLGGLAVAFGLRETLANLFSGMNFTLAGNINVGDYVKLGSGEEGYVEDIQWRVTRIRTLFDTVVVIPNHLLAETVVTNYHQPAPDVAIIVPVGVHSASDLEEVERLTCQIGRQIMETIPGAVPGFAPWFATGRSEIRPSTSTSSCGSGPTPTSCWSGTSSSRRWSVPSRRRGSSSRSRCGRSTSSRSRPRGISLASTPSESSFEEH